MAEDASQGARIRRGLMFVLSSPSGAGKTTLARQLLAGDENFVMSVSATTRPQRPGEAAGKDYLFLSDAEFEAMVQADKFLEHATVFSHHYGTPAGAVEAAMVKGLDVLFDIDWQGAQELAERARGDLVSVFVLPPSMDELHRRLTTRAQDSAEVVAGRMSQAADEISHWAEYDYVLVNDVLEDCFAELQRIVNVERLRRTRQTWLTDFVRGLRVDPEGSS